MSWLEEFWKNMFKNPFSFFSPNSVNSAIQQTNNDTNVNRILSEASKDPTAAQGDIAREGLNLTPEQEKYLDNLISQQNVQAANDFQEHMRNTSVTSTGEQLQALGLSPSGVLNVGAASSGVQGAVADNVKTNIAQQKYAQRMAIAKQLLSMTSSMASAGVYGSAYLAAKKSSAILASQAANSARLVTHYDANDHRTGRTLSETLPPDFDYSRLF